MQIQNGIPAPVKVQWKANLDKMKVEQSARIDMRYYNSVKAAISMPFHRRSHKAFTTAKESSAHFRVWRIR